MRSLAEQRLDPQIHLPAHQEADAVRPRHEPEGIRAITFSSILFENPQDSLKKETAEAPDFFSDLNLDQIIDAVTAGRQEYNLKPFFYTCLDDVDTIKYRQEVAQDLENEALLASLKSFAQKMIVMRRYLAMKEKLHYKYHKEGWFLEAVIIYCDAVDCLAHDLSLAGLKSRGLSAFREYMTNYAESDSFRSLLAETKKLKTDLSTIKYCVLINGDRVKVRKYEAETDYSADVEETFEKFKQGAVKDYRSKLAIGAGMNHVEANILDLVAKLYPDIFLNLDDYCTQNADYQDETLAVFDREIQFYVAYLDYLAKIKRAGLKLCYPQIVDKRKEVYDYEGFDLALASKLIADKSPVVCNDFYLKDNERIFVVSGPNQGGKTTFARTFGQLHYLAGLGCPVPGKEAQLFLCDRLFTHFEKEENIQNLRGKLQDDLVRIHRILDRATPNSIVIMKAFLMHKDQDFDLQRKLPPNEQALTQDLELNPLFNAMALGDAFLFEVAKKAVFSGLNNDLETIRYRQSILKDCLKNSSIVRGIYDIAVESIENKQRHHFGIFGRWPSSILHGAIEIMEMFVDQLKKLKNISDKNAAKFESEGFKRFFVMIHKELEDEYLAGIQNHLRALKFRHGVLLSAELGKGNEGTNYILRKPHAENRSWMQRIFAKKPPVYTFSIHPRDEAGGRALSDLKDRGINLVANALAQSADHIESFFKMLRIELAFYMGCLNLYEQLARMGEPVSFPLPAASSERRHSFRGLYDVCLALTMQQKIVGNDANADNKELVIITGANQGGKSTFLRSIGLAQLMMQCGMFAPAESFCANICSALFTHYKREEDAAMESGKLDEELSRMSDIVNHITPDSMVLFNESFAATNEREGSEIARQIVCALLEKSIKEFFVTHLYEFPKGFYDKKMESAIFLRADRQADGKRPFRLIEGGPLQTSFGEDLYQRVFGTDN